MAAGRVGRIKLGSQVLKVSARGLGCMGMSTFYGPPKPEQDMIALILNAVHSGVTFFDTSDIYGPFTNEILLGKQALKGGVRERVELATKYGISYAGGKSEICGDPAYVRAACEASLKRLLLDCIDLYYQHRIDARVPIEVAGSEVFANCRLLLLFIPRFANYSLVYLSQEPFLLAGGTGTGTGSGSGSSSCCL